jgi:predicted double-glycine peptidase
MNHPVPEVSSSEGSVQQRVLKIPPPSNMIRVPIVQQKQNFSCGPAATLILMRYWCIEGYENLTEVDLYEALRTTRANGTEPEPMVELFRRNGLQAEYRTGDVGIEELEHAVLRGEPPVVDLQAWSDHDAPSAQTWDAGHYVVMVGFDDERLFFADPSRATPGGYAFLPRAELEERWHDLAGESDTRVEHMCIFVRGTKKWISTATAPHATKLG